MNLSCIGNRDRILTLIWPCIIALFICACGDGGETPEKEAGYSTHHNWARIKIADVNESGLTVPYVVARQADNRMVYVAYYDAVPMQTDTWYQQLNYSVWNPATGEMTRRILENRPAPSGADGFDRCDQFDLALDGVTPVFIYPTYEINDVLQQVEADIMVNLYEGGIWNETTGAVGFVERNPVYQDGHTTDSMSVAVDSNGDIHFAYQYYTEGMDSANFRYPDLYYAKRERATLADPIVDIQQYANIEEKVDGNSFSTYGIHNSVGFYCKLLLDQDENPVIIYAEHGEDFAGTFALKAAYRSPAGLWTRETIDALPDGWKIGGISAAYYPPDPEAPINPEQPEPERPLAVAYALRSPNPEPDDSHRLLFAVRENGRWSIEIVDETTWCGAYPSLAFTPDRFPAIAYYDEESHSGRPHRYLKYAEFNGILWERESADEKGDIGKYNSLWFNAEGQPVICTFADEDNEILLIQQTD